EDDSGVGPTLNLAPPAAPAAEEPRPANVVVTDPPARQKAKEPAEVAAAEVIVDAPRQAKPSPAPAVTPAVPPAVANVVQAAQSAGLTKPSTESPALTPEKYAEVIAAIGGPENVAVATAYCRKINYLREDQTLNNLTL